jgi:hypothetical protein
MVSALKDGTTKWRFTECESDIYPNSTDIVLVRSFISNRRHLMACSDTGEFVVKSTCGSSRPGRASGQERQIRGSDSAERSDDRWRFDTLRNNQKGRKATCHTFRLVSIWVSGTFSLCYQSGLFPVVWPANFMLALFTLPLGSVGDAQCALSTVNHDLQNHEVPLQWTCFSIYRCRFDLFWLLSESVLAHLCPQ